MRQTGSILAALLMIFSGGTLADDRKIDVKVVNGQIEVPEINAQIKRAQGTIMWELVTPGYLFPGNGIIIKAPPGTFSNCRPIGGGSKFQCKKDRHRSLEIYKYDVNVSENGRPLPTLDPYINLE